MSRTTLPWLTLPGWVPMAETIVLEDGSHAVLLTDPNKIEDRGPELLQLIRDKLGAEAAAVVERWQAEVERRKEIVAEENRDLEIACDGYRAALQDVWDSLEETLTLFAKPRLPRAEVQKRLQRCIESTKNEL